MANMVGRAFVLLLICAISQIEGALKDCGYTELTFGLTTQTYQESDTMTREIQSNTNSFKVTKQTGNTITSIADSETCGIIQKSNLDAEIVLSMKMQTGTDQRFCFKAIIRGEIIFYTESTPVTRTALTREQCTTTLAATATYMVLTKLPLRSPASAMATSISTFVKPGTYEMDYQFDNKAWQCENQEKSASSITIGDNYMEFNPCGFAAGSATYTAPFGGKRLYTAAFVPDSKLDVVNSLAQKSSGFILLVYADQPGELPPYKYFIAHAFQSTFQLDERKATYFELNMMTTMANAYNPVGYIDTQYIPGNLNADQLNIRTHTEECKSGPCKNGGECIQRWQGYQCICLAGFEGTTCEKKDTECSKNTIPGSLCSMNGVCEDVADGYICKCTDGFTGPKCAKTTNCKKATCKNEGVCYDNGGAYCACVNGWAGKTCELKSTCATTKPCKNGAVCFDKPGGDYYCECTGTFTGKNCDGEEPPPGPDPGTGPAICMPGQSDELCQNSGKCIDYKCKCMGFYVGKYCENMNRWFIASIVLIVLLCVVLIVTLIVCCCFCARGRKYREKPLQQDYDPFATPYPPPPSSAGFSPTGYVTTVPSDTGMFVQQF